MAEIVLYHIKNMSTYFRRAAIIPKTKRGQAKFEYNEDNDDVKDDGEFYLFFYCIEIFLIGK